MSRSGFGVACHNFTARSHPSARRLYTRLRTENR